MPIWISNIWDSPEHLSKFVFWLSLAAVIFPLLTAIFAYRKDQIDRRNEISGNLTVANLSNESARVANETARVANETAKLQQHNLLLQAQADKSAQEARYADLLAEAKTYSRAAYEELFARRDSDPRARDLVYSLTDIYEAIARIPGRITEHGQKVVEPANYREAVERLTPTTPLPERLGAIYAMRQDLSSAPKSETFNERVRFSGAVVMRDPSMLAVSSALGNLRTANIGAYETPKGEPLSLPKLIAWWKANEHRFH